MEVVLLQNTISKLITLRQRTINYQNNSSCFGPSGKGVVFLPQ